METPIGEIRFFSNLRNDSKYLLCDGSRIDRRDYPELESKLPQKYVYDTQIIDSTFGEITQVTYFPEKNIYIMIRRGSSAGFGIFTSTDGRNWVNRYTASSSYTTPPAIQYIPQLGKFVGSAPLIIIVSDDGINWSVSVSLSTSGAYHYTDVTYSERLGKALVVYYRDESTYYSYVHSTTDFVTWTTEGTINGGSSANKNLRGKIIEDGNNLYASSRYGTANTYLSQLWVSTDNGVTFTQISEGRFNTDTAIKLGSYWYSAWASGSTTGSTLTVVRTSDLLDYSKYETILSLERGAGDTWFSVSNAVLGVINGFLFLYNGSSLIKIDEAGNQDVVETNSTTTNLNYFDIRNYYIKIDGGNIWATSDFNTWYRYDELPIADLAYSLFYTNNMMYVQNSDTKNTTCYFYDENCINLPIIDFCNGYIKATSESGD